MPGWRCCVSSTSSPAGSSPSPRRTKSKGAGTPRPRHGSTSTPAPAVRFLSTDGNGGYRWRSAWPALALQARGIRASVHRGWPMGIGASDIVICHRPLAWDTLDMLRTYQEAGITVLVNEDDDLTSIPDSFDVRTRWKSKLVEPLHDRAIAQADGLIVTTPRLEEVYGPMARRTWILPNLIAEWVLDLEPHHSMARPRKDVVVGYAGVTHVHRHDLRWLAPYGKATFVDAVFSWTGVAPWFEWWDTAPALLDLGHETRISVADAVWDPRRFYLQMGRCDIGIVPLDPGVQLNWSKSSCKALEYMALGKPVVVSDLPE